MKHGCLQENGEILDGEPLEIPLVNDLREIAAVAAQIDEFCAACNLEPHVAYAVNLSVEEILTNTISYGYDDDEPHRIDIRVSMDGSLLAVEITDDSIAFDPSTVADPDIEAALEDRPLGGLGLFLANQMMDSVEFRRGDGCNIVILTKETGDGAEPAD